MQGDTIVIEEHHWRAARAVVEKMLSTIKAAEAPYTISVAGESGSGKSETATAIAEVLAQHGIESIILQQDDYFVYPPMSNDRKRREDISWVGTQEVRLSQMDENLKDFIEGKPTIEKPLVIYKDDKVISETLEPGNARVAIAEGTYTSLLENVDLHIFINRSYLETRAHREKRSRHKSELDPFIDKVLEIEHEIISSHRARAELVLNSDYTLAD